jgi:hypothetical protein
MYFSIGKTWMTAWRLPKAGGRGREGRREGGREGWGGEKMVLLLGDVFLHWEGLNDGLEVAEGWREGGREGRKERED